MDIQPLHKIDLTRTDVMELTFWQIDLVEIGLVRIDFVKKKKEAFLTGNTSPIIFSIWK